MKAREIALGGHAGLPGQPRRQALLQPRAGDRERSRRRSPPSASGPTRCPTIKVTYKNVTKVVLPRREGGLRRPAEGGPVAAGATRPGTKRRRCSPRSRCWSSATTCRPRRTTSRGPRSPGPEGAQARASTTSSPATTEDFGAGDNVVNYTDFWVRDLAIVDAAGLRQRRRWPGWSTDDRTGEPVDGREGAGRGSAATTAAGPPGEAGTTDKNGLYGVRPRPDRAHIGRRHARRTSNSPPPTTATSTARRPRRRPQRADGLLHRPLALPARPDDPVQGHLHPRRPRRTTTTRRSPNRDVTVMFTDVNGKEIARQQATHQRLRLVLRQLHRPARPAHGPHVASAPASGDGVRVRHGRGVQAAEVPGGGRGPEGGRQAQRHGEGARQGDRVHRRAGRRGEGHATASSARCATPTGSTSTAGGGRCRSRPAQEIAHGIVHDRTGRQLHRSRSSPSPT